MYTEADLEALVPRKVFDRGLAYYGEYDAVGRIKQKGDTYKAKVTGTETYHVELTVRPSGPPDIYCDCPYDYGPVCKHGIALGLAVLDLVGPADEPAASPAPAVRPPAPKENKRPARHASPGPPAAAPRSLASLTIPWAEMLEAAWPLVSDKNKQDYLRYLLHQQPQLVAEFLDSFKFDPLQLLAQVSAPAPKPRPRTFVAVGEELLATGYPPDLLPHLLRYDWRGVPEDEAPRLAALLAHAARQQPEATLDAVMERIEKYLAATQRGSGFYPRLVGWLSALHEVPAVAAEVRLFASELWKQYGRRAELRGTLTDAGFAPLPDDLQEESWRKEAAAGLPPAVTKRRGRPPRPR